jgi:hypothetical protein
VGRHEITPNKTKQQPKNKHTNTNQTTKRKATRNNTAEKSCDMPQFIG